ncbi:MAG: hypothetical protein U0941_29815 [Planctomycetaceae bacterium]
MLTMTKSRIEADSIKATFDDKIRGAESALLRIADGVAEPGDTWLVKEMGWSVDEQRTQLQRLRGVALALEAVGTADDLQRARSRFETAEASAGKSVPTIDSDIQELRDKIAELQSERDKLTNEVAESEADLKTRMNALNRLRSQALLPQHVTDELNARKRSLNASTATRQQELTELVAKLRADGARLKNQTNGDGSISSPDQLQEYVDRAQADTKHRAYEFWRDRVFSVSEWRNFDQWCQRVAGEYEAELEGIRSQVANTLADEAEELQSFYTSEIE